MPVATVIVKVSTAMTQVYYIDISILGYDAEVLLNGAPILRTKREVPAICAPTVTPWAIDGDNELRVLIEGASHLDPSPTPTDDSSPPQLKVALASGELGEIPVPGEEHVLAHIEWTPPDGSPPVLPVMLTKNAKLAHPWGTWAWQTAPVIPSDPATAAELTAFVQLLHNTVGTRQFDLLIDACQVQLDEVSRCFGMDPADARAGQLRGLEWATGDPAWSLAPLDPADLIFRPCCDGRLVEPMTRDGQPILRQAVPIDGQSWAMPMFIGRVGGEFRVLRS